MLKTITLLLALSCGALAQGTTPAVNTDLVKTVATLPTCNSGSRGTRLYVTDALLPAALATVAAGGAVIVPVFCNGSNWIVM